MDFFSQFTSNTLGGSGNQMWFSSDPETTHTGRVFYRISHGGAFHYSLLFANLLDSTFDDGSEGHCNQILPPWQLLSARVASCPADSFGPDFMEPEQAAAINASLTQFQPLTFQGQSSKQVAPGEFFCSDPVLLALEEDAYLCVELTFRGTMLPYHPESLLPVYHQTEDGWQYNVRMPLPSMIGCDRPVRRRIGFLGDSITQGIGAPHNSYLWWNALLARNLPADVACWNLGLGCGRASDLASGGAWLHKALQNDIIFLCYGVNDLQRHHNADILIYHLEAIVNFLTLAGKTIIIQTVPPFVYHAPAIPAWEQVNDYIRTVLFKKVACVLDVSEFLGRKDAPDYPIYGAHPDTEGSAVWADALWHFLEEHSADIGI